MTDGWPLVPLRRLATIMLGKMLQSVSNARTDTAMPYLRAAHVQPDGLRVKDVKEMWFSSEERQSLSLLRDDVVVVEGGAGFGRSACLERDMEGWAFQNSINRVRPRGGHDGRFLNYSLLAARGAGQYDVLINQATIPHLTAEKLALVRVPHAPEDEQRNVADFLDHETGEIDAFIADQERLIELLTERRNAALDSAIDELALGRGRLLGWISEIEEMNASRADLPLLSVSIHTGVRRWEESNDKLPRAEDLAHYKVVREGDVVLNRMRAFQGAVGVAGEHGVASPDYAVLRPSSNLSPRYLEFLIRSSRGQADIRRSLRGIGTEGSGVVRTPRVAVRDILRFPWPVPSLRAQHEAVAQIDRSNADVEAALADAREAIALSKERRAALISAAVTGKIDVRDWQPPATVA